MGKATWKKVSRTAGSDKGLFYHGKYDPGNGRAFLPLKLISKVMKIAVRKMSGGSKDETDPQNRMAYSCSADCAIFGIVQTGVGFFSEKRGKALVDIANGHILRGILGML